MMRDMPVLTFFDPGAAQRRLAKTADEMALCEWLRTAARDRAPDGVRGGPFWYLVAVRPGNEVAVTIRLLRERIMAFCPRERIVEKVPRGQGKRIVRRPLYPGYLFVRLSPGEPSWAGVMTFDGVQRLVPSSDRPSRVSEAAMAKIRAVSTAKPHRKKKAPTLFVIGERVMIKDGPFADFDARVVRADNARGQLVVEARLFGGEVPVELELDQVRKL